jgi:hypothetical protein
MTIKKLLGAAFALGVALAQPGAALAACAGDRDPQFSQCNEDGTAGQMINGFITIVDLVAGEAADGHSFDDNGDEIFECATRDTIEGLGNRDDGASVQCATPVAEVQVTVE